MNRSRSLASLRTLLAMPRRFRRDEDGATAVEFGMVAMPFLFLIFAIFETALTFWSSQILETAVANASRKLYTGEYQTTSAYATQNAAQRLADFKTALCANVTAVFNCNAAVSVDVRTFTDFSTATASRPVRPDGTYDPSSYGFQDPGANQITVVRASMEYPIITRLPSGPGMALRSGNRLLMASATFRTEPYR